IIIKCVAADSICISVRICDDLENRSVHIFYVFCRIGQGKKMAFPDKEDKLMFGGGHVVMSCGHFFKPKVFRAGGGNKQHILRQIDIASCGIWLVNRSKHQALTQKKLILYLRSMRVRRVAKSK